MSKLILPKATTAAREAGTPVAGEILYDKEKREIFFGDGATAGGVAIGSGSGTGGASFQIVTSLTEGNIVLTTAALPVGLMTDLGNVYLIESGTMSYSNGVWTIDPTDYLAHDESASFTGPWTIYLLGGGSGKANATLSNLTGGGKGVIMDVATDLDWANAEDVSYDSVVYQASKAGIFVLRTKGGYGAVYASKELPVAPVEDSFLMYGDSFYRTGSLPAIVSVVVPKGYYYFSNVADATVLIRKFIPFKNSLANI